MAAALSTEQLLQLSPDKLLETHTVAEAEVVGQQLAKEVERKREELRVMVGERYRDLIEAADTIQNMRLCSSSVIQSVAGMQQSCSSLQHQSAMQAVTSMQAKDLAPASANSPYLGVAAAIKLLTAVPELIWAAVEAEQFSLGAQLFLLAQHVHTGLLADAGGQVTAEKIAQWFPVIARQWATIQQLQSTLLTSCQTKLSAEKLSQETAVDSLTAIMLLKNCTIEQIFQDLLSFRSSSLSTVLLSGRTDSARPAICSTASCIIASVQAVHQAFIQGGLIQSLSSIMSSSSPATIELVGCSTLGPIARHLPSPIMQFRPRLRGELKDMDKEKVVKGMMKWLEDVGEKARVEAKALLQYVITVEGLAGVREGLYKVLGQARSSWNMVVKDVLGKEVCLWDTLYRQIVTKRVVELLGLNVCEVVGNVKKEVKKVCDNSEYSMGEVFVWTEATTDLGINWGKGQSEKGGLEMKCWSWTTCIQEICVGTNEGMKGVLDSMMAYIRGEKEDGPFDKFCDNKEIVEKCSSISRKEIAELVASLRSLHVKDNETTDMVLLLARLYQALLPLTPSLVLCVRGNQKNDSSNLAEISSLVDTEAGEMFNLWIRSKLTKFSSSLLSLTLDHILHSLPAWDKVTISETGDSGQEVTSIINIPPSPSLSLINSLISLASGIHAGHPSSFPKAILPHTLVSIVQAIIDHYSSLAKQTLTQNFALQLLFDIHFIQTLLVSRDSKDQFSTSISSIVSSLETNIDPFDLSVFSTHLQARVKRASVRCVSGLGCLVPEDRVVIISSYKTPSTSTQDSHNILCLEPQPCPRFQLLPLAPGSKLSNKAALSSAHLKLPQLANQAVINAKKMAADQRDRSPVHQTATSFFGSMPWFGTNN